MGNWRTVRIVGTCDAEDVGALADAIAWNGDFRTLHCLSASYGLCGIGFWAASDINAEGNLSERDYSVEDVAVQLEKLLMVAPSLDVVVHCGGDFEHKDVIASIVVSKGEVKQGPLLIKTLRSELDQAKVMASLAARLGGRHYWRYACQSKCRLSCPN
jgi:hypothetical protein